MALWAWAALDTDTFTFSRIRTKGCRYGVSISGVRELQRRAPVSIPPEGEHGQIIATGEGCKTRANALKGIESVRKHAQTVQLDDNQTT